MHDPIVFVVKREGQWFLNYKNRLELVFTSTPDSNFTCFFIVCLTYRWIQPDVFLSNGFHSWRHQDPIFHYLVKPHHLGTAVSESHWIKHRVKSNHKLTRYRKVGP